MNDKNIQNLLELASKKLGVSAEKLQSALESGNLDDVTSSLKPEDKAKINGLIKNPNIDKTLQENPQIKEIVDKLDKSK